MDNKTTRRSFFRRDDAETTPAGRDRSGMQPRSRGNYSSNDSNRESSNNRQDRPNRSGSDRFGSDRRSDDSRGGARYGIDSREGGRRDDSRGGSRYGSDSREGGRREDSRGGARYGSDSREGGRREDSRGGARYGSDSREGGRREDSRGGARYGIDSREGGRRENGRTFDRDAASSPFVKRGIGSYRRDEKSGEGHESPFTTKKFGNKPHGNHSSRPNRDDSRGGERRDNDSRKPFGKDLKQYDPEKFDRSSDSAYNKDNSPRRKAAATANATKAWKTDSDLEQKEVSAVRSSSTNSEKKSEERQDPNKPVRLNRFIGMSGVCSRREADELILAGEVKVNGVVADQLGMKVVPSTDIVEINGQILKGEKKVYIIMNKPKGYVTTVDDPHADRTVIDLLRGKCKERVYPVGRLDKNTTGVLLLTNDGDLTKELTHPSYEKVKIYHVFLDKPATENDLEQLAKGIELEDGFVKVDNISFVDGNAKEVGVELHSGRNRIVRRMFEHLGYEVVKLDRVYFAGMGKMALRRGFWRYLTPREVSMLKNKSYK